MPSRSISRFKLHIALLCQFFYLTKKWNECFGNGILVDPTTKKITQILNATEIVVPSYVSVYPENNETKDLGAFRNAPTDYYIKAASIDKYGKPYLGTTLGLGLAERNTISSLGTFPNALAAYNAIKKLPQYSTTLQTMKPTFFVTNEKNKKKLYYIKLPSKISKYYNYSRSKKWCRQ